MNRPLTRARTAAIAKNTSRKRSGRRATLLLTTMLTAFCASSAYADPTELPYTVTVDENGVDLATGELVLSEPEITFGPTNSSKLSYVRSLTTTGGFLDNLASSIAKPLPTQLIMSMGAISRTFNLVSGSWVPEVPDGETLTENASNFVLTDADGTVLTFTKIQAGSNYHNIPAVAVLSSSAFPNGERHNYTYYSGQISDLGGGAFVYRLSSVTSTSGYQIHSEYGSDQATPTYNDLYDWWRIVKVSALNLGTDFCDPASLHCTGLSSAARSVTYSDQPGVSVSTLVDGSSITYITDPSLFTVRRNADPATDRKYSSDEDGRVTSVVTDKGTWTYAFDPDFSIGSRTAPDGGVMSFSSIPCGKLNGITNEVGKTTSYSYLSQCKLSSVQFPEGDKLTMAYDARGNVIEMRRVAKPGSGLADLVQTTQFPASCTNQKTCNKPTWTKDAAGNQTDYTYDPGTGLLLTVTAPPPDTNAVRPQTRSTYAPLRAYYKDASGQIVTSGQDHWLLSSVSSCATNAQCSGTADEVKTTYGYGPQQSGTPNNLLPVTVTAAAGDGSVTNTVTTAYDARGNPITVDGPLSGAGDTSGFRYDAAGRSTGVISPDPDDSGPRPRVATRTTYNADGMPIRVETGSLATWQDDSVKPADWTGFTVYQSAESTYDGYDRQLTAKAKGSDGSVTSLTQTSYDNNGRAQCSALRMNPSVYGSLPGSACSLGTNGTQGADRIVKQSYDLAGRVTEVRVGLGTSDEAADQTNTYTNNGQLQSVSDGEHNLTTYEYDGLDRLAKTRFPSTTQGAGTSSSTDYEQNSYDAYGKMTGRRLRDGTTMSYAYDALGRVTQITPPSSSNPDDTAIAYSYDNLGRMLLAAKNASNQTHLSWDALGRKVGESNYYYSVASQYDPAGRRTRLTWHDGLYATYEYDNTGAMLAVRENGSTLLASYSYDGIGRRSGITRANGVNTTYAYDVVGRLASLSHDFPGTANDLMRTFSYNPAGQITARTTSNDAYAWTGATAVDRSYTSDGLNRYTAAGSIAPSYDARGNLTSAGSQTYQYTASNRLGVAPGVGSYYADSLERMDYIQAENLAIGHDGPDAIAEMNFTTCCSTQLPITRRYVYGAGDDEPLVWYEGSGTTDKRWLTADELGSVTAVTNGSGGALSINTYDAFGNESATSATYRGRYGYTGQAWIPSLALNYYKARMYSPGLGRFLQTDPIGYGDGQNLYNYVGSDPVNATDPAGLQTSGSVIVNAATNVAQPAGEVIVTAAKKITNPCTGIFESVCAGFIAWDGRYGGELFNRDLKMAEQEERASAERRRIKPPKIARLPRQLNAYERRILKCNGADDKTLAGVTLIGVLPPFAYFDSATDGQTLPADGGAAIFLRNGVASGGSSLAQMGLIAHEFSHAMGYNRGVYLADILFGYANYGYSGSSAEVSARAYSDRVVNSIKLGRCR